MQFLVYRAEQQQGPYDEEQLLAMLRDGAISRKDLIFHEGMEDWKPMDEVFEIEEALMHYMDEGQEADVVAEVYQHASHLLGSTEQIFYIAHQKKRMMKSKPDCVVVTSERLIIVRQGLSGSRTEDFQWKDIMSVQMKEGLMGTTFSVLDRSDHIMQVDDLPKPQLERVCQLAQEMRGR
jgi:hypothetical protein